MKIRTGFVSNSSGSSFCLYGAQFERDEFKTEDPIYEAEALAQKLGLHFEQGPSDYYVYIGREWTTIKDDETGKQFKESIEKKIAEVFPEKKCCTYEEGWFNG